MRDPAAVLASASSLTRKQLLLGTMVPSTICGVLAIAVVLVRQRSVASLFASAAPVWEQVLAGLLVGTAIGATGAAIGLRSELFAGARSLGMAALGSAQPGALDLAAIAVAAGVGEELLFRGTLQPAWGLVASSLVFTVVHFWVPIGGTARAVYVTTVLAVSLLLGLLFLRAGLTAAIVAHATTDLWVLLTARRALMRA